MGNSQSFDARHIRIWNNLTQMEDDSSRMKMLDVLFSSPEHVEAAKRAGIYSSLLQWTSSIRRGTYAAWPVIRLNVQPVSSNTQLTRIPPPKRALDTLFEAYKVLDIDDRVPLTRDSLRQAYKKAGFRTHPDRGGNSQDFDEVRRAYEYLEQVLDKLMPRSGREEVPVTVESATRDRAEFSPTVPTSLEIEGQSEPIALNPKKLDMNVFNKLFEENRLPDPEKDEGYGEWLKSQENTGISANLNLRGKYNKDIFNQMFLEEAKKIQEKTNTLTNYKPPSELTLAPHLGAELGASRPDQYTNPSGKGSIAYTDLKHAYGSGSTFSQEVANIDASKNSKTFEQAKQEYGTAPKPLTAEQVAAVASFEASRKQAEEARQRRAAAYDVNTQNHYERLQKRLLIKQ